MHNAVMQASVRACIKQLRKRAWLHAYLPHPFALRRTACCVQGSVAVNADANGTDEITAAAYARALHVQLTLSPQNIDNRGSQLVDKHVFAWLSCWSASTLCKKRKQADKPTHAVSLQANDASEEAHGARTHMRDAFHEFAPLGHSGGATGERPLARGAGSAALGGSLGAGPASIERAPSLAAPLIGNFAMQP